MVESFLADPPPGMAAGTITLAGRQVHALDCRLDGADTTLYGDLSGGRWLIGGDRETFTAALEGRSRGTLEQSGSFRDFRARTSAGEGAANVLFVYADVEKAARMLERCTPPLLLEEVRILGLDTLRGLAFGITLVEGGVRESLLVGFSGQRRGFFAALRAAGGGFRTLAQAPADAALFVGLRFDPTAFKDELLAALREAFPRLHRKAAAELQRLELDGLSLLDEVLPALGSEASLALSPPKTGVVPDAALSLEVRDERKFATLLDALKRLFASEGLEVTELALKDGEPGFALRAPDMPVIPAFALRQGRLVGAISALNLKSYLARPADAPSAQSSEVLVRVQNGLNGGRGDALAFLFFLDLRSAVPAVINSAGPFLQQAFDESGTGLDAALLPLPETFERHLTGVAAGISVDDGGLSVDVFSPAGLLPFAAVAAAVEHRARVARMASPPPARAADDYK
jgi:hypothetical protein